MKIRNLILAMLASLAVVSCTNEDVLEDVNTSPQSIIEESEAFLSFSIVQGASTRALVEGTSSGDTHGDAENSGHTSTGTSDEANVEKVLIVYYNTDANSTDGFCGTFDVGTDITVNNGAYSPSAPFQVNTTGEYKVAVVLNPCSALETLTATNRADALNHYSTIVNGTYSGDVSGLIGANKDYFMMTNKSEVTIKVEATNNFTNPATPAAAIEVERVVAKLTYRTVKTDNIYDIQANQYKYELVSQAAWVKAADGSRKYYENGFYPAHTGDKELNNRVKFYVAIINDTPCYYIQEKDNTGALVEYEGLAGATTKKAISLVEYTLPSGAVVVYEGTQSTSNPTEVTYKVQLTDYALFNLNTSSYYVRHTSTTPAVAANTKPFGQLLNGNYLMDPYTTTKSTFEWANGAWTTTFDGAQYFGTTAWGTVKSGLNNANTWTALPTGAGEAVEGDAHGTYATTGALLGYVMENSVKSENQLMDMTTGIVFKAKMMDASGNPLPVMFEYNGSYFKDLESLNAAVNNSPLKDYSTADYEGGIINEAFIEALGVNVFENGECYYVAVQLKHFDDGDDTALGINEYSKVRNNVYSVGVTSVQGFGFSESSIEELHEISPSVDESIYLTLDAQILPWIVRYTDVEF